MARGPSKTSEEKIQAIEDRIQVAEERRAKIQTQIADLKAQKQAIENDIQAEKLAEIAKVIEESGKTPQEIMDLLKTK